MTATALLNAHGQMGLASGGTCGVSGLRPSGLREAKECHWGWALTAITLLSHRYSPGNRSTKERSARKGAYRQGRKGRVSNKVAYGPDMHPTCLVRCCRGMLEHDTADQRTYLCRPSLYTSRWQPRPAYGSSCCLCQ